LGRIKIRKRDVEGCGGMTRFERMKRGWTIEGAGGGGTLKN
jgi:hypothetical protein